MGKRFYSSPAYWPYPLPPNFHLHADIRCKIAQSNENYKLANAHRRSQEFNAGEYVLVRIHLERYPKNSFQKLHARAIGPHRIIRKFGPNAYLLDLPYNMSPSPIFNVEDLIPYRGTFEPLIVHAGASTCEFLLLLSQFLLAFHNLSTRLRMCSRIRLHVLPMEVSNATLLSGAVVQFQMLLGSQQRSCSILPQTSETSIFQSRVFLCRGDMMGIMRDPPFERMLGGDGRIAFDILS